MHFCLYHSYTEYYLHLRIVPAHVQFIFSHEIRPSSLTMKIRQLGRNICECRGLTQKVIFHVSVIMEQLHPTDAFCSKIH